MRTTHTDNLPTLYHNIMDGLPDDLARKAFLWAVKRPGEDHGCYRAENFAREVSVLAAAITLILDMGASAHGLQSHDPDLRNFILTRHANQRYGGNVRPSYV